MAGKHLQKKCPTPLIQRNANRSNNEITLTSIKLANIGKMKLPMMVLMGVNSLLESNLAIPKSFNLEIPLVGIST